jgi:choline dehydrogenase-like flavoprotein
MNSSSHHDVIIVRTGAGGGTLAHRPAPSGKRILVLECGDYVPCEKKNWSWRAINLEARLKLNDRSAESRQQAAGWLRALGGAFV